MILIAGGTGLLGTQIVHLLSACGCKLRVLTRNPARAQHLNTDIVEIVTGDVRNGDAVDQAVAATRIVISAIQGFSGTGSATPQSVDLHGNTSLIQAARKAGAERFILVSVHGAAPDHPIELFRMKYLAEQELKASGLSWSIIRPTAYMETWVKLIGQPLVETGKTRIFGQGNNPINFVSAYDVAQLVKLIVTGTGGTGEIVEVGGPDNLSMRQVAQTFMSVTGRAGIVSAVPLPALRLMSVLMRPANATLARQIRAAVVMDTTDMSFDPVEMRHHYPAISQTSLADAIRRDFIA